MLTPRRSIALAAMATFAVIAVLALWLALPMATAQAATPTVRSQDTGTGAVTDTTGAGDTSGTGDTGATDTMTDTGSTDTGSTDTGTTDTGATDTGTGTDTGATGTDAGTGGDLTGSMDSLMSTSTDLMDLVSSMSSMTGTMPLGAGPSKRALTFALMGDMLDMSGIMQQMYAGCMDQSAFGMGGAAMGAAGNAGDTSGTGADTGTAGDTSGTGTGGDTGASGDTGTSGDAAGGDAAGGDTSMMTATADMMPAMGVPATGPMLQSMGHTFHVLSTLQMSLDAGMAGALTTADAAGAGDTTGAAADAADATGAAALTTGNDTTDLDAAMGYVRTIFDATRAAASPCMGGAMGAAGNAGDTGSDTGSDTGAAGAGDMATAMQGLAGEMLTILQNMQAGFSGMNTTQP